METAKTFCCTVIAKQKHCRLQNQLALQFFHCNEVYVVILRKRCATNKIYGIYDFTPCDIIIKHEWLFHPADP